VSVATVETRSARLGPGQRIRYAIGDGAIVAERNLISLMRVPTVLVFELVQPVMFTLLFRYVFGGAIAGLPPGINYVVFLMPGIFAQNAIFGATTTAIGIADDLKKGMIDRFRSLPMSRSAMLIGRTTADLAKNFIVVTLMIGVGYLVGFSFKNGFLGALGVVGLVLAVGFSFSWISAAVGLAIKETEAVQAAIFTAIFPIVFMSTVFVPLRTMPGWLQVIARNNPVSQWATCARILTVGTFSGSGSLGHALIVSALWIAGILVVFVPLAVRLYRKLT
jgi:ABC-2 type transport system permease protein/oleandomycin transport system permease protein